MAPVQDYMESKLFINYGGPGGGGFSEAYKVNTTVYATANANLLEIIANRAALLPYQWSIVHATNSRKMRPGDSSLPVGWSGAPILLDAEADITTDAPCNDREVCLIFTFDTNLGKQQNRLIRAIRDSWVEGNEITSAWTFNTQVSPFAHVATAPADGSETALENFMHSVGEHTSYFVPGNYQFNPLPAPTSAGWDPLPWAEARYNRVGTRDMGKGFSSRKARRKARI